MKKYSPKSVLCILFAVSTVVSIAQAPAIQWQKSFGGTGSEQTGSVKQTVDGGYIVAGNTVSSDGDVTGFHGLVDFWIVKTDANGNLQWQKCLGGSRSDGPGEIQQTNDGGYIVAGATASIDGDVSGRTDSLHYDCWIVKLDSAGSIQWQKSYGGSYSDVATAIEQTSDGGYVFAGWTNSNDGDVSGNHSVAGGNNDYWVVKIDSTGNIQWQKCLGGINVDDAFDVQQTTDQGYVVAGWARSNNGDVTGHQGGYENYWIVKLDSSGTLQWQKALGCIFGSSQAYSVKQTRNNGFIVAGSTNCTDGDVVGNHGSTDYWVILLDSSGNVEWKRCYGGPGSEGAYSVALSADGGYFILGLANTNGGDVTGSHGGGTDYWVLKLDSAGTIQWKQCYGGSGQEGPSNIGIEQTADGGCILAGASKSNDGDVSGNHGSWDFWIVKLEPFSGIGIEDIYNGNVQVSIFPNPANEMATINFNSVQFIKECSLYSIDGKYLNVIAVNSITNQLQVDMSKYEGGVYLIKANTKDYNFAKRVIVQH